MADQLVIAPDGQIWVCPACGRTSKDRYRMGDTSCVIHAVLCYEKPDPSGLYRAVEEEKKEDGGDQSGSVGA